MSLSPTPAAAPPADLGVRLRTWAQELGFADAAIATQDVTDDLAHLRRWLDAGLNGTMDYLARNPEQRARPALLRPGTVSVISARLEYWPRAADAQAVLDDPTRAYISRYALGRDYHKLLRARLKKLAERIRAEVAPHGYRVLADSAPALEKALARNAGLGWIGKNTLLLHPKGGSFFFLGEIYTDLPLEPAAGTAVTNACGRCTACLDLCPTGAIVAPYKLDARRCISYLTIETREAIPLELRPLIGNRIFGCDDCQLVCPWNRYARVHEDAAFAPRHGLDAAALVDLFRWTESQWLAKTEGMALRRAGYVGWLRNLAVALGNAPASAGTTDALRLRADHENEVVREHVRWALERHAAAQTPGQTMPGPEC